MHFVKVLIQGKQYLLMMEQIIMLIMKFHINLKKKVFGRKFKAIEILRTYVMKVSYILNNKSRLL